MQKTELESEHERARGGRKHHCYSTTVQKSETQLPEMFLLATNAGVADCPWVHPEQSGTREPAQKTDRPKITLTQNHPIAAKSKPSATNFGPDDHKAVGEPVRIQSNFFDGKDQLTS